MRRKAHLPSYSLDYKDGLIIVNGQRDIVPFLSGCARTEDGKTFYMQMNPTNVMVAESLGDVEFMTTEYLDNRAATFQLDQESKDFILPYMPALKRELKSYQKDFISLSFGQPGYINGSEQGTGKTIATLVAVVANGNYHASVGRTHTKRILLLTSKDLIPQWFQEIEDWFVDYEKLFSRYNFGVQKVSERIADFNYMITQKHETPFVIAAVNYETFISQAVPIAAFCPNFVIADESWKIMHEDTSDTAQGYVLMCDFLRRENASKGEDTMVFNLTGTLVSKHIGNVWAPLVTSSGERHIEYKQFVNKYALKEQVRIGARKITKYTGCGYMPEVMRMLAPYYYRATKASCLDLPEKVEPEIRYMSMAPNTKLIYQRLKREGVYCLNPHDLSGDLITNTRLLQVASGFIPCNVNRDTDDLLNRLYGLMNPVEMDDLEVDSTEFGDYIPLACIKLDTMCQTIETEPDLENNQRIIWCKHRYDVRRISRRLQNNLRYRGIQVAEVMGGQNIDLQEIKNKFNNRDHPLRIIVCTIDSMCFGHNLQGGDINEYFSLPHKPIVFSQSTDRTHRLGRTEPVYYRIWLSHDTLDVDVWQSLQQDREFAERVEITTI